MSSFPQAADKGQARLNHGLDFPRFDKEDIIARKHIFFNQIVLNRFYGKPIVREEMRYIRFGIVVVPAYIFFRGAPLFKNECSVTPRFCFAKMHMLTKRIMGACTPKVFPCLTCPLPAFLAHLA